MQEEADLQKAIQNLHQLLIEKTGEIVELLTSDINIYNAERQWVEYALQLRSITPEYAIPSWLNEACKFDPEPIPDDQRLRDFAKFVTLNASDIREPILIGDVASLNLEQLFTEQSERFELNKIFENLVSKLSEIIAADVIDNRVVHDSLKRLNALFRRTKNGSLSTVLLTMNFGKFVVNSFGGVLKANKYAKPIIENFEAEFTKASEIVRRAEEETKKEMVSRLINSKRMELFLESNPELKDTVAGYLPAPPKKANSEPADGDNAG